MLLLLIASRNFETAETSGPRRDGLEGLKEDKLEMCVTGRVGKGEQRRFLQFQSGLVYAIIVVSMLQDSLDNQKSY